MVFFFWFKMLTLALYSNFRLLFLYSKRMLEIYSNNPIWEMMPLSHTGSCWTLGKGTVAIWIFFGGEGGCICYFFFILVINFISFFFWQGYPLLAPGTDITPNKKIYILCALFMNTKIKFSNKIYIFISLDFVINLILETFLSDCLNPV